MRWSLFHIYVVAIVAIAGVLSNNDTSISDVHTNNSTNSYAATNHTSSNNTRETIFISSLKEICLIVEIPEEDCSCEKTPDLCQVENDLKPKFVPFPKANFILATLSSICLLFGIIGNSAVLAVSYMKRQNLPRSKKLITQVAFVDLVCSVVTFMSSVHYFWTYKWVLGEMMCKITHTLIPLCILLPVGYNLIIALERFFGIIYPLHRNLSSKKTNYTLVGLNLIFGIGAVIPLTLVYKINEHGTCEEIWQGGKNASLIYNWFLMIFYFVLPVGTTVILYTIIMCSLSRQLRSNQAVNREDIMRKRIKSNRRTMIILISVLVAFVICVLPTRVSFLYMAYRDLKVATFEELKVIAFVNNLTYPLHVAVNPIIYSAIDREWRKDLFSLFTSRRETSMSTKSLSTLSSLSAEKQQKPKQCDNKV